MVTGSEMGDNCTPASDPEITAPIVGNKIYTSLSITGCINPANELIIGMLIGNMIASVPHEEPVPSATSTVIINTIKGNQLRLIYGKIK